MALPSPHLLPSWSVDAACGPRGRLQFHPAPHSYVSSLGCECPWVLCHVMGVITAEQHRRVSSLEMAAEPQSFLMS